MILAGAHGGADPFVIVLAALTGDLAFAGLPGLRRLSDTPTALLRHAALRLETRLNRPNRSAQSRTFRGVLVAVLFALAGVAAGLILGSLVQGSSGGWVLEAATVALLLVQRRAIDRARRVGAALAADRLDHARTRLRGLVPYDTVSLDEHGLARGAVQSCARRLCDGVVGAVFWYLLLGLPGLSAYRALNALARAIAHPAPRLAEFGRAASWSDRVLSFVPDAIAAVLVAAAAVFVPAASAGCALGTAWGGAASAHVPAGRTQGAMAGALGVAFGGPVRYHGVAVSLPWIGDGRARANHRDIARAVYLMAVTALLVMAVVALLRLGFDPAYSPT